MILVTWRSVARFTRISFYGLLNISFTSQFYDLNDIFMLTLKIPKQTNYWSFLSVFSGMASLCVPLLSQRGRIRAQRPQTKRAKSCSTGETGVRGHFYDWGQRLGRRTYLWTNYHWSNTGKFIFYSVPHYMRRANVSISISFSIWLVSYELVSNTKSYFIIPVVWRS